MGNRAIYQIIENGGSHIYLNNLRSIPAARVAAIVGQAKDTVGINLSYVQLGETIDLTTHSNLTVLLLYDVGTSAETYNYAQNVKTLNISGLQNLQYARIGLSTLETINASNTPKLTPKRNSDGSLFTGYPNTGTPALAIGAATPRTVTVNE